MLKRTKKEIVYIKKKRVEVCDGVCVMPPWCVGFMIGRIQGFNSKER